MALVCCRQFPFHKKLAYVRSALWICLVWLVGVVFFWDWLFFSFFKSCTKNEHYVGKVGWVFSEWQWGLLTAV